MSIRASRNVLVLLAAGAASVVLAAALPAQSPPAWPPISAEDAAMKDCPQQPGAPAVILFREETTEGDTHATSVFKRLKILTDAGREYSNIEIPFMKGVTKVTGIQARVVTPDGSAREFTGQVFDKTVLRYRTMRVAAKTFALPDVAVGAIIDYRYKIEMDMGDIGSTRGLDDIVVGLGGANGRPEEGGTADRAQIWALPFKSWRVQEDLFTKKAKFVIDADPGWIKAAFGRTGCRTGWASIGRMSAKPVIDKKRISLDLADIPAFEEEELSVPEEALRASVDLFYISGSIANGQEFWKRESQDWQKGVEAFLGKPGKFADAAKAIVGDATDPATQLKRIYVKAQGLRNLSYEKGLTRRQRKEQKIKDNDKVSEVLDRGFGLRSDITRTFVALARDAGFEANVVRVAARDDKVFRDNYLSFYGQLDSEVALVKLGGRLLAFDPATPFCPFGLVHWSRTNSMALRFSDNPPAFFSLPVYPPDMALTQREIALALDPQGGLAGTVKTTYTGQEALVRRLDHIHDDDAARREALEKELTGLLPMGATAKLTKLENIDNNDPRLIASYDVAITGFAMPAGDKILLPLSPLAGAGQYPFRHEVRKSPVYIPFPFRQFDDIVVTVPQGLAVEVRPEKRESDNDFSSYFAVCSEEGPARLHIQRDLSIKKSYFTVEQYAGLKSFFDKARAVDEEQIVLAPAKKEPR
jgi:hypothetical protein